MSALASCVRATKRFGAFTAVNQVNLEVGPGEIVGLLGANGAGKTTLIRMLLGLLATTEGDVTLFGRAAVKAHPQPDWLCAAGLGPL